MDPIGVFITRLHRQLGHDKAAAYIGVPAGDKQDCLLCDYEENPDERRRQDVTDALSRLEELS
jgi:hypothetical protein